MKEQHKKVYEYVKRCLDSGYSPTVRDICKELGIASTSTASRYVNALVAEGYLEKDNSRSRSVRFAGVQPTRVPVYERAGDEEPAGYTAFMSEYLRRTDELFAVRITDDSLKAFGILTGDTVIFLRSDYAQRGDIVCASENGSLLVRRFVNGPVGYLLTAEGKEPLSADDTSVIGRSVGLVRDYLS
ncbi:MAG: hypothetical protein ILP19_06195 [Oscillospiraceae bacterium]|nr:hypothetical protein [Oscillospiraceae bacterium]